jgi:hypothetical protein
MKDKNQDFLLRHDAHPCVYVLFRKLPPPENGDPQRVRMGFVRTDAASSSSLIDGIDAAKSMSMADFFRDYTPESVRGYSRNISQRHRGIAANGSSWDIYEYSYGPNSITFSSFIYKGNEKDTAKPTSQTIDFARAIWDFLNLLGWERVDNPTDEVIHYYPVLTRIMKEESEVQRTCPTECSIDFDSVNKALCYKYDYGSHAQKQKYMKRVYYTFEDIRNEMKVGWREVDKYALEA